MPSTVLSFDGASKNSFRGPSVYSKCDLQKMGQTCMEVALSNGRRVLIVCGVPQCYGPRRYAYY